MCKKTPEFKYLEPDLKQRTKRKIVRILEKNEKKEVNELEEVVKKLLAEENELLGENRTVKDVLKTAKVPRNVFSRMVGPRKDYKGPKEEACIRIGLAIGCNIRGINMILTVRGSAKLSKNGNGKFQLYNDCVVAILSNTEMPLADRVTMFREFEYMLKKKEKERVKRTKLVQISKL